MILFCDEASEKTAGDHRDATEAIITSYNALPNVLCHVGCSYVREKISAPGLTPRSL